MESLQEKRNATPPLPGIPELGTDLLQLNAVQKVWSLLLPFLAVAGYFSFAAKGWWVPAVLCLVYFSFVSYGSISHDLVHRNLGLPRWLNETFLTVIELLAFRSGHAYRLSHLNHHARFPHDDDIEGRAARRTLFGAVLEGFVLQFRIVLWSLSRRGRSRGLILGECAAAVVLLAGCIVSSAHTLLFITYAALLIAGSWVLPLATVYIPHNALGDNALSQTRRFRGKVFSVLALQHLYHLEHHLYPAVPHHHWPELARRLDPYFEQREIRAVRLWF